MPLQTAPVVPGKRHGMYGAQVDVQEAGMLSQVARSCGQWRNAVHARHSLGMPVWHAASASEVVQ
eukprot:1935220-Prymnesium_polylepis.1